MDNFSDGGHKQTITNDGKYGTLRNMRIVSGKVIHGRGYGRKLGFPTANIDRREYSRKGYRFKYGIYGGVAVIVATGKRFAAGIVIGPDDARGLPHIEAHLLRFSGNLYGKEIELSLEKYLRPFYQYDSEEKLKRQIRKDISAVREL